jgi:hypothetical protein
VSPEVSTLPVIVTFHDTLTSNGRHIRRKIIRHGGKINLAISIVHNLL